MKKLIVLISILLNAAYCFSQDSNNVVVYYNATFNPRFDRGRKDIAYTAKLCITDDKSRFFMVPAEDYVGLDENDLRFIPDTSMQIYADLVNNQLFSMEYNVTGKSFYVADTLFPMHWIITQDSMLIGNLHCKKAVCDFRGRHYTAWFAEELSM
ncbi:MAG: GLPGLI family protein, partial [Chitinophagaceae bacterium]